MRLFWTFLGICFCATNAAWAWEAHSKLTRIALEAQETGEPKDDSEFVFQAIETLLPQLKVTGFSAAPRTKEELALQLQIHDDKVNWAWDSEKKGAQRLIDILAYSSEEPDAGMDQNHNLTPDQKYMGGFQGSSSQGIRHMFYLAWNWRNPIATFHIPTHEMGFAPEQAQLYFDLAKQAKEARQMFWAYRFLGWAMHYAQDISQPYHANQFASVRLLPVLKLITREGWDGFVAETTRRVGNFHLSFEEYVRLQVDLGGQSPLAQAFRVPRMSKGFAEALEDKDLSVVLMVRKLAAVSSSIAADVVDAQRAAMGKTLFDPQVDYINGSQKKVDYQAFEQDPGLAEERKQMLEAAYEALSNAGTVTRWMLQKLN